MSDRVNIISPMSMWFSDIDGFILCIIHNYRCYRFDIVKRLFDYIMLANKLVENKIPGKKYFIRKNEI